METTGVTVASRIGAAALSLIIVAGMLSAVVM